MVTKAGDLGRTHADCFSAAWGDVNNDGRTDVLICSPKGRSRLYIRTEEGTFIDVTDECGLGGLGPCWAGSLADVDNDGNAEIVFCTTTESGFCSENLDNQYNAGIEVWGDASDTWVSARRIWNQHAYHVTNVNEDGSVPAVAERNWLIAGLNNFRQNVQGEGLFQAPDLTARLVEAWTAACQINGLIIWAQVSNRGSRAVAAGVPVSFYRGDPRAGGQLLGTVRTTQPLRPFSTLKVWGGNCFP